jgi:hypothetical protein
VAALALLAAPSAAQEVGGALRAGVYVDGDHTTVLRCALSAHELVDVISSASIDVRTSLEGRWPLRDLALQRRRRGPPRGPDQSPQFELDAKAGAAGSAGAGCGCH